MKVRIKVVKSYIDEKTYNKLKQYCEKNNISVSTFLLLLIKKHLVKEEK